MLSHIQTTWDKWVNKHRILLLFELPNEHIEWFCDVQVISATVKQTKTAWIYTLYFEKNTAFSLFEFMEEGVNGHLHFKTPSLSFTLNQNGKISTCHGMERTTLNRIAHCFLPLCDMIKLGSLAFKETEKQREKYRFEQEISYPNVRQIVWDEETYPTVILRNKEHIPHRDIYDEYLYQKSLVRVQT